MTCIVALKDKHGNIHMGADSVAVGSDLRTKKQPKIFRFKNMLIGCSGYPGYSDIINYRVKCEEFKLGEDPYSYLISEFIPALKESVRSEGRLKIKDFLEELDSSYFIVGLGSRLFEIQTNFQLVEYVDDFNAIGSGVYYATASLWTSMKIYKAKWDHRKILQTALECAEQFCDSVRGPFHFETLEC